MAARQGSKKQAEIVCGVAFLCYSIALCKGGSMTESVTKRRSINTLLAFGLGGVLLSGCGSGSESTPEWNALPKVSCTAEDTDKWNAMPTNFNAKEMAKRLGVSEARVTAGKLGNAVCDRAVKELEIPEGIGADIKDLDIQNIDNRCLAIGFQNSVQDSKEIVAVCPSV